MGGQRVRTIHRQGDVTITRDAMYVDKHGSCEHSATYNGGFPNIRAARSAVAAVEGVSHAYISSDQGGSIFYGLASDEPDNYLPVAQLVATAILAI
ncbi:MAG TPA: hypothetical protein VJM46_00480 [Candidatus Saccharimonadales bacterium]|nr:hypothetical protein [Candidatus Saccharimonadales bacterium]